MDFSEFCDRLLERTDIVKLISRYVTLKRAGSSFKARCPFHNERTPSFSVDPVKQLYHCFGCGKGGNAITFLRDIENIDTIDAIKMLADEAHMELPSFSGSKYRGLDKEKRLRLYSLMREAARHYNANLSSPRAQIARDYIEKRLLPPNIVTRFGLGYSFDFTEIIDYLKGKGYTEAEMKEAGLIERTADKWYDVFHGRLIFPIISNTGEVVAFGGRALRKDIPAKYRNSTQTEIFDKSKTVYALNLLKKKRRTGPLPYVIMCEGYMDVIALHKAGFDTAVASMGTSLTYRQAKQLKNYSDKVIISYDGDTAGQKATMRGLDILRDNGLTVKVARMPEGKDPDEVINEMGREAYERILEEAMPLTAYKLDMLRRSYDMNDRDDKTKYAAEAVKCVKQLENPVEREEYLQTVAEETGYDIGVLRAQANVFTGDEKPAAPEVKPKEPARDISETFLLAAYVAGRPYVDPEDLTEIFPDGFERNLVDSVTDSRLKGIKDTAAMLYTDMPDGVHGKLPEIIEFDLTGMDDKSVYDSCVRKLKIARLEKKCTELAAAYDETRDIKYLQQCSEYKKQIKKLRESGGR